MNRCLDPQTQIASKTTKSKQGHRKINEELKMEHKSKVSGEFPNMKGSHSSEGSPVSSLNESEELIQQQPEVKNKS